MNKKTALSLITLFYVAVLASQHYIPFYTRGSAREALVVQKMYYSKNYIVPRGYADSIASKPPFFHWLGTAISHLTKTPPNELTVRAASVLFSFLFAIFFYLYLLNIENSSLALTATFILLAMPEWFRHSFAARVDITLASLTALALLIWFKSEGKTLRILLSGILTTFAVLTKGPVGFVLPAIIAFLYAFLFKKNTLKTIGAIFIWFALVLLGAGSWYTAAYIGAGDEFLQKVINENFARFLGTMPLHPHNHSVFYLLGSFFLGTLPFSLLLLMLLPSFLKKNTVKNILNTPFAYFSLLVVCTTFLFFTIPQSKRGVYLLPSYPFLAYLFAKAWFATKEIAQKVYRKYFNLLFFIIFTAAVLACLIFPLASLFWTANLINNSQFKFITQFATAFFFTKTVLSIPLLTALIALGWAGMFVKEIAHKRQIFVYTIISLYVLILTAGLPTASALLTPKHFVKRIHYLTSKEKKLYSFKNSFYAASFYLNKDIYPISFEKNLPKISFLVLTFQENLSKLQSKYSFYEVKGLAKSTNFVRKIGKKLLLVRLSYGKKR